MHMKKTLAPLAALLLTATALSAKDNTYTNPVYPKDWPDPTVWQAADGKFYCLSTGQNARRPLLCSDDLVEWDFSDIVPLDRSIMKQFRSIGRHVWAPDVAMVNGRRMAYFTLYNSLKDASIVALRESPTPGKFEYVGVITRGKDTGIDDTIDPEVVTDPATGKVWLFFGSMGRIHRIELSEYGSLLRAPDTRRWLAYTAARTPTAVAYLRGLTCTTARDTGTCLSAPDTTGTRRIR